MHTSTDLHRPTFNPALRLPAVAAWHTDPPRTADTATPAADDDQDWLDFLALGLPTDLHTANNRAGLRWLRAPVLLSY